MELHLSANKSILVLNSSFEPINITSWRRAVVLVLKEKAQVLSRQVIRLLQFVRIPFAKINAQKPSRAMILKRDNNECQYCGWDRNLTLDHVIPQSRGGKDTWENLVACCYSCNNAKDNKTPEEWGVPLRSRPKPPKSRIALAIRSTTVSEWKDYIYQ